jgi:hypothetical protein
MNLFKCHYESFWEIDLPLQSVWNFCLNPNNWSKAEKLFDTLVFEEKITKGSVLKAKIKDKNIYVPILISDLQPYENCETYIKIPFFTQKVSFTFQEISSEKTGVKINIIVESLFVPFMKAYFKKKMETTSNQWLKVILEEGKVDQ